MVDGHFVLKVTDYGFTDILETLRLSQEKPLLKVSYVFYLSGVQKVAPKFK